MTLDGIWRAIPRTFRGLVVVGVVTAVTFANVVPAEASAGRIAWNGTGPGVNFSANSFFTVQVNTLISSPAPTVLGFNFYGSSGPSSSGAAGATPYLTGLAFVGGHYYAQQVFTTGNYGCSSCSILIMYSYNGL